MAVEEDLNVSSFSRKDDKIQEDLLSLLSYLQLEAAFQWIF